MILRSHLLLLLLHTTSLLQSARVSQDNSVLGGDRDPYIGALKRVCVADLDSCKSTGEGNKDYLLTLLCLERNLGNLEDTCQKEFFSYKLHLYTNPSLIDTLEMMCGDEMSKHCDKKEGPELVVCLFTLDGSERLRGKCPSYLKQLGQVIFSDYSALADIIDGCYNEIARLRCTVGIGKTGLFGSPVAKIAKCILGSRDELTRKCASKFTEDEVVRKKVGIEENCRTDVRNLCGGAQTKNEIYDCLVSHLIEVSNSRCFDALITEYGYHFKTITMGLEFYRDCMKDIRKEACAKSEIIQSSSEGEFAKLIDLFQCLEKPSIHLSDECEEQVHNHRHVFFGDYHISIELARACDDVREEFCPKNLVRMIDCIKNRVDADTEENFETCAVEVNKLSYSPDSPKLPQSNSQYPDLSHFCDIELNTVCSVIQLVEYEHKLKCLVHNIAEHGVAQVCRDHIGRVQFFSNQLESKVFTSCHKEYKGLCNTAELGKKACLMSYYADSDEELLSVGCRLEVEGYLQEAATKRNIHITLLIACLPVLGEYCDANSASAIECLKNNREHIDHTSNCYKQLDSSVKDPLSPAIKDVYKRCNVAIDTYCSQVKDILGCLQEWRNFPNLDSDCMNALKQVIDTEWKFDSQLNSNCKGDISFHCPLSVGVMEATRCLTRKFRSKELTKKCNFYFKDLLKETTPKPTDEELLKRACQDALSLLCPSSTQDYYLSCLIYFKLDNRVSESCRGQIITEEINLVVKKYMTKSFYQQCSSDMARYCRTGSNTETFLCLKSARNLLTESCKNSLETDLAELNKLQLDKDLAIECHSKALAECGLTKKGTRCLTTLLHNLEAGNDETCIGDVVALIGQSQLDIHNNPDLAINCEKEITKYCIDIIGQKLHCLFSMKDIGIGKISWSCMEAMNYMEKTWRDLYSEYPNILRGLDTIIDHVVIDHLMKRGNSNNIFKVVIFASLAVGCVALCCLGRLCRATRRIRRKIM